MPHPKTILITGSSSGIGEATAKLFSQKGWNVAATMRSPAPTRAWANAKNVLVTPLDVTDPSSITGAVARVKGHFGGIDVVFNNAGYGLNGPLEGATEEQMGRQFDVNFFGVIRVTQAVLPHMRAVRSGLIITNSSIGGVIGMPISPLYISSKHAVEGLMESARFELKPHGVRVKLIEPGGIRTDFLNRSNDWTFHPDYEDYIQKMKSIIRNSQGILADPADVAKTVYRAATDRSDRLRYLAKPGPFMMLYTMLPDWIWRGMVQRSLK